MNTNIMQYIISYTIIYLIYLELFIFKSPQYSSIIETLLSKGDIKLIFIHKLIAKAFNMERNIIKIIS